MVFVLKGDVLSAEDSPADGGMANSQSSCDVSLTHTYVSVQPKAEKASRLDGSLRFLPTQDLRCFHVHDISHAANYFFEIQPLSSREVTAGEVCGKQHPLRLFLLSLA
jgi:hypothetical protein